MELTLFLELLIARIHNAHTQGGVHIPPPNNLIPAFNQYCCIDIVYLILLDIQTDTETSCLFHIAIDFKVKIILTLISCEF